MGWGAMPRDETGIGSEIRSIGKKSGSIRQRYNIHFRENSELKVGKEIKTIRPFILNEPRVKVLLVPHE